MMRPRFLFVGTWTTSRGEVSKTDASTCACVKRHDSSASAVVLVDLPSLFILHTLDTVCSCTVVIH